MSRLSLRKNKKVFTKGTECPLFFIFRPYFLQVMGVVKIVPILFLLAVGCACAQSEISDPSEPTLARPAPREHRGFYNSVSFAFAYNWYNNSNEDIDYYGRSYGGSKVSEREIDYFEYNGFTFPLFEFKFGVALANLVAFHSVFNLGFYTGSLDYF